MPKQGEHFEDLTAEIFESLRNEPQYESVEKNVKLPGADCERQIDVLLRGKVGPFENITIIECKDHNKVIDITKVDALDSVRRDVNADKAVLVARKGFSRSAIQKAKRLGIRLCTAHSANHEKWKFDLEIPFSITELSIESIQPNFLTRDFNISARDIEFTSINDTPIHQIVAEHWNSGELEYKDEQSEYQIRPGIKKPWLRTRFGGRLDVLLEDITVIIKRSFYFGLFNNLESSRLLRYIEDGTGSVVFDLNELANYRDKTVRYNNASDIPNYKVIPDFKVKVIINPTTKLGFRPSMRKFLEIAKPH